MSIPSNVLELIGGTPLVRINRVCGSQSEVLAKLEYFNPGGSVKDRVALSMINDAEDRGLIDNKTIIIEPTSGNTGIGLAMVCAVRGYRLVLTMPESASMERRHLLRGYGADLVLTPAEKGMKGAIARAEKMAEEEPRTFIPYQFRNEANPDAHYRTTGPEIWQDSDGRIDILVAGVGTGGTLTGTGRYLREFNPELQIIAVEPEGSPVLAGGKPGKHKIQGIGAGFVPDILETGLIDEIVPVSDEQARLYARRLMREEGLMAGYSAGAAACVASRIAGRAENRGKTVVFIAPDSGERYLSSGLYEEGAV